MELPETCFTDTVYLHLLAEKSMALLSTHLAPKRAAESQTESFSATVLERDPGLLQNALFHEGKLKCSSKCRGKKYFDIT